MNHPIRLFAFISLFAALWLTGYTPKSVSGTIAAATSSPTSAPKATQVASIDPGNFGRVVDNPYFPLIPGTTFIYEGKTAEGIEHIEVIVRPETKVILGVTCVVVLDTVTVNGQVTEATLDWYAQDKRGNVWYFGEDTKEYQNGKVVSTEGAWEAGVNGAQPGYIMKANPAVGDVYRQEYYKGQAEDMAAVISLSATVTVPAGTYSGLLVTTEWSSLANPLFFEHKYYAKGVGQILTKYLEGSYESKLIEIRKP